MLSLGLDHHIVEALRGCNITIPTPVQRLVIPRILAGESLVARSQTGSGKSVAYLAPLVQLLRGGEGVALVVVPTRELVQQVGRVAQQIGADLDVAQIYGGVEYDAQLEALARSPRLIISTVGRLQDLIARGDAELDGLQYFILDEADQMVDMGFREDIISLMKYRAEGAQTLCFSATLNEDVEGVVGDIPRVECDGKPLAAQSIEQRAYYVEQGMMEHLLLHLLRGGDSSRVIVFCRSRKMVDRLTEVIRGAGFSAEAIHSDRSQAAREHILDRFSGGETNILVASDLIARGIDVLGVEVVYNFGLPTSVEQYIHRIGRTGRAGASGVAITLLCADEQRALGEICATLRQTIQVVASHPYMTPSVTAALANKPTRKKRR